jgi:hypothetical protein
MNVIFSLHEIFHETKRREKVGVVLKLDFEKAYDKNRGFLMYCLLARGFDEKWCSWIRKVLTNGTVGVKINSTVGPISKSTMGLGKGILYPHCCSILQQFVSP